MRKPRDREDTRERALQAAEKIFAEHGFAGTSLAMIAQESGLSDGLILHHFQSKGNLYHQVLDGLAMRYASVLQEAQAASAGPAEALRQVLAASFNFWKQDTTYNRISLWAYLEQQGDFSEKETAITARLAQGIAELQEKGAIDRRYTPVMFLNTIIGSMHFWVRYRESFKTALALSQPLDELDQRFLDQLIGLTREMSRPASDVSDLEGKHP